MINKQSTGTLTLDRNRHRVVDTPIATLIRERTGDDDFFTYYHLEKGYIVLAQWVSPTEKTAREYPLFFRHPMDVSHEDIQRILRLCGPAQWRRLQAAGKDAALSFGRFLKGFVEEERERESRRQWARRKVSIHKRDHPLYVCGPI